MYPTASTPDQQLSLIAPGEIHNFYKSEIHKNMVLPECFGSG
jgi:hypothetical protein